MGGIILAPKADDKKPHNLSAAGLFGRLQSFIGNQAGEAD